MKVAISATSKFHAFDLAREMHARGALEGIFSGYPRFKLRQENLPQELIRTFPYVHAPSMALSRLVPLGIHIGNSWEYLSFQTFDTYVASHLPSCDVFVGQSGSALFTGRAAHRRGIRFVCDRGPAHIRVQDRLLREEHDRWGIPFRGIDPRVMEREEAEYAEADRITVPSSFALRSFLEQGIPKEKLRKLQYGVDLSQFCPAASPDPGRFDVLFVGTLSLQKGVPYLTEAFRKLQHSRKSLTFAGSYDRRLIDSLRQNGVWPDGIRVLGHVPKDKLKGLISRSHVLVLPSIQDGFGLVLAEAMACGCVVIGTPHTGAPDLVTDGQDGFIVPVRDSETLAQRLQWLADDQGRRVDMARMALQRVQKDGGWHSYGEQALAVYNEVLS